MSKNGQWRSSPKVPNLLQYVSNENCYGRIKIGGKIIRESLKSSSTIRIALAMAVRNNQTKNRFSGLLVLRLDRKSLPFTRTRAK